MTLRYIPGSHVWRYNHTPSRPLQTLEDWEKVLPVAMANRWGYNIPGWPGTREVYAHRIVSTPGEHLFHIPFPHDHTIMSFRMVLHYGWVGPVTVHIGDVILGHYPQPAVEGAKEVYWFGLVPIRGVDVNEQRGFFVLYEDLDHQKQVALDPLGFQYHSELTFGVALDRDVDGNICYLMISYMYLDTYPERFSTVFD